MQAVILAAGESSRFWPLNKKHKSLIKIMGKPLIWHTIEGLKKSGIKEIIIIQGPKRDIEEELSNYSGLGEIKYTVQYEPKGTGDALWQARNLIKGAFVLLGPHKVDISDYLPSLIEKSQNGNIVVLTGVKTNFPWDHGVVRFKRDKVLEIVENPGSGQEPSDINAAETYVLPRAIFDHYEKVEPKEDNLIDSINFLIKAGGANIVILDKETVSLKYPWRLFYANEYLLRKIKKNIIGEIESNVKIIGPVIIEKGTVVKSGAYIEGPVYIGKDCEIGPNCFVRPFTSIGDGCHIGNAVEIKDSIIGDDSNVPHLSYVGDSIIGKNCNLGAGTITANLRFDKNTIKALIKGEKLDTGRRKFGCVIGDNTQTGTNCSLMPGVLIGSGCEIWPNSLISENIEDNSIFYTNFESFKKQK